MCSLLSYIAAICVYPSPLHLIHYSPSLKKSLLPLIREYIAQIGLGSLWSLVILIMIMSGDVGLIREKTRFNFEGACILCRCDVYVTIPFIGWHAMSWVSGCGGQFYISLLLLFGQWIVVFCKKYNFCRVIFWTIILCVRERERESEKWYKILQTLKLSNKIKINWNKLAVNWKIFMNFHLMFEK